MARHLRVPLALGLIGWAFRCEATASHQSKNFQRLEIHRGPAGLEPRPSPAIYRARRSIPLAYARPCLYLEPWAEGYESTGSKTTLRSTLYPEELSKTGS